MRDIRVAINYLLILTICAPILTFISKGLIVLEVWLRGVFDSLSRAEVMAITEARRQFDESITAQILEPALAGVAIFILILLARVWNGSWLHD